MIVDHPKTDAEWQAQEDARTLAQAEQIKADEERLTAAKTAAAKMAEKEREEMNAMRKVAGKRAQPGPRGSEEGPSAVGGTARPGSTRFNVFQKVS